jgi:hypothetical protein
MICLLLTHVLSLPKVDLIFKRFDMLDDDGNGYLTPEETYLRMSESTTLARAATDFATETDGCERE